MKKYPKIVQCDQRGQIVIPKDIRSDLDIEGGTGFWLYSITDEGILLKVVHPKELSDHQKMLDEIELKSSKLKVDKKNLEKAKQVYKKTRKGKLELI